MPDLLKEIVTFRQFMRASLNNQLVGDEVARIILESLDLAAIGNQPEELRLAALVKAGIQAWLSATQQTEPSQPFSDQSLLSSVGAPPSRERQVVLLIDVIGIAVSQVAQAFGVSEEEVLEDLTAGRAELDGNLEGTVIIMEDEPLIAEGIADLVRTRGVTVLGMARSKDEAVELANQMQPDVIMADFDLGEKETGLDAVKYITGSHDVAAIFITAYPDEVLTGEDFEPTFVIAKPYDERAVLTALAHYLRAPHIALDVEDTL